GLAVHAFGGHVGIELIRPPADHDFDVLGRLGQRALEPALADEAPRANGVGDDIDGDACGHDFILNLVSFAGAARGIMNAARNGALSVCAQSAVRSTDHARARAGRVWRVVVRARISFLTRLVMLKLMAFFTFIFMALYTPSTTNSLLDGAGGVSTLVAKG